MNRTLVIVGVLVILVILGFALMRSQKSTPATQQNPTPQAQTTVTSQPSSEPSSAMKQESTTKEVTVTGQNFSFSPDTIEVKKGDKVKITFKNSGGTHDFIIDAFNVATKRITSGQEETVQFTADKAGQFEFYCSVGNHRDMGMKGTLTVK